MFRTRAGKVSEILMNYNLSFRVEILSLQDLDKAANQLWSEKGIAINLLTASFEHLNIHNFLQWDP